jgi:hypothetical protein
MHGVQNLGLEARRGGVRHRVGGDDLWIVVPLEDEPMVVSVPLDAKPGHLPALDGTQLLDVELGSGSTVRVRAVGDNRYRPEDIWRIGGVRCPPNTDEGRHVIFHATGRRGGSVEEKPGEDCHGNGSLWIAGTTRDRRVVDLDRGLECGDGGGVAEDQVQVVSGVPAVRVRLAIAAVDQAQALVLELPDDLSARTFGFSPELLVWVDVRGVEIIVGDQALQRVHRNA